jgi:GcrA cell cycle regulator
MELEALFDVPQSAAVETLCSENTSEAPQYQIKKMGSPLDSIWRNLKVCARVEELWKDHSSSQIASAISGEFSVTVTRNAVIGYLHRAKLTSAKKTKDHPQHRPKGPSQRKRTPAQFGAERQTSNRLKAVKPTPFLVSPCDVEPRNISLMDLKTGDCRFVYGDGPFLFCGQPAMPGYSWCTGHAALVFAPRLRGRSA